MKLPESTEWVLHAAAALAQLGPGGTASAAQLAEHYDLPVAYLSKQLQALVRAGVLSGATGPRGGFRMARPADQVTLLDVVEAVDGGSPFYTCGEIRQRGRGAVRPEQCRKACSLAAKMADAEAAWRQSLRAVTIADIVASLPAGTAERTRELLARPQRLAWRAEADRRLGFPLVHVLVPAEQDELDLRDGDGGRLIEPGECRLGGRRRAVCAGRHC